MGRSRHVTPEEVEQMKAMHARGMSYEQIAVRMERGSSSVSRHVRGKVKAKANPLSQEKHNRRWSVVGIATRDCVYDLMLVPSVMEGVKMRLRAEHAEGQHPLLDGEKVKVAVLNHFSTEEEAQEFIDHCWTSDEPLPMAKETGSLRLDNE